MQNRKSGLRSGGEMNNNFKLEKGMYQEPGRSFSQVLEDIDPSDRYIGTPLEGLDAFQRQLKLSLIHI